MRRRAAQIWVRVRGVEEGGLMGAVKARKLAGIFVGGGVGVGGGGGGVDDGLVRVEVRVLLRVGGC